MGFVQSQKRTAMEFPHLNLQYLFQRDVTRITRETQDQLPKKKAQSIHSILYSLAVASARNQRLQKEPQSAALPLSSDMRIFVAYRPPRLVLGYLKMGQKIFSVQKPDGSVQEILLNCVYDFYVHETHQKCGVGKLLMRRMLIDEGLNADDIAFEYTTPSLVKFLKSSFQLDGPIQISKNGVVFSMYNKASTRFSSLAPPIAPNKYDSPNAEQKTLVATDALNTSTNSTKSLPSSKYAEQNPRPLSYSVRQTTSSSPSNLPDLKKIVQPNHRPSSQSAPKSLMSQNIAQSPGRLRQTNIDSHPATRPNHQANPRFDLSQMSPHLQLHMTGHSSLPSPGANSPHKPVTSRSKKAESSPQPMRSADENAVNKPFGLETETSAEKWMNHHSGDRKTPREQQQDVLSNRSASQSAAFRPPLIMPHPQLRENAANQASPSRYSAIDSDPRALQNFVLPQPPFRVIPPRSLELPPLQRNTGNSSSPHSNRGFLPPNVRRIRAFAS